MQCKRLKNDKGGEGLGGWITPTCQCGWKGKKHYAYCDAQHSNADEEWERHNQRMVSAGNNNNTPCPFCGSINVRLDSKPLNDAIVCDDCGASGPVRKLTDSAWKAWNKRAVEVKGLV